MQLTTNGLSHFLKPTVIVWENVPRVLSSADNAFGCFLAGLAGDNAFGCFLAGDAPFEPGDRPESGKSNAFWRWDGKTGCHAPKWPQCGCIYGPQRKVAGESLMPNTSEWHNDADACLLSQVLEQTSIPQRYF